MSKLKCPAQLKTIVANLRKYGKKIVFTNGCFDILHIGHVKYLEKAKKYGDVLIVGLNSDSSVRKIKGKSRPLNKQKDRALVLAALGFIDYVVIFNEDTPYNLISILKPDVLVKGSDWHKDKIVGAGLVNKAGGKVIGAPFIKGFSTTKLIRKIIETEAI